MNLKIIKKDNGWVVYLTQSGVVYRGDSVKLRDAILQGLLLYKGNL